MAKHAAHVSFITKAKAYFHSLSNTISGSTNNLMYSIGLGGFYDFQRKDDALLVKQGYTGNSDVYAIVKRIADNIATIKPIFEEEKGGELQPVTDQDVKNLLLKPKANVSYQDFIFNAGINLLNTGDLFLHPLIPVGFTKIVGFRVLESAATDLVFNLDRTELEGYIYSRGTNKEEKFTVEEIIHIKYADPSIFGIDSGRGLSPLQAGYLTLQLGLDTETAGSFLMKNRGAAGFLTDESEEPLEPKDYKALQADLQKKIGGAHNFNKVKVSAGKFKYIQMGMSPGDLKLFESQVLTLRKLCNLFGTDSSLFNDPANKTFNNRPSANKAMYQDAVIPTLQRIFSGIQAYLETVNISIQLGLDTSGIEALQEDKLKESMKNQRVTDSVLKISAQISERKLTLEGGINILTTLWGFSEDDAKGILQAIEANEPD